MQIALSDLFPSGFEAWPIRRGNVLSILRAPSRTGVNPFTKRIRKSTLQVPAAYSLELISSRFASQTGTLGGLRRPSGDNALPGFGAYARH
jgi:hypothetical protein